MRPERKPKVTEKDSHWQILVSERAEVPQSAHHCVTTHVSARPDRNRRCPLNQILLQLPARHCERIQAQDLSLLHRLHQQSEAGLLDSDPQLYSVVRRVYQILLRAQIPLGSLG
jgi:hypothetical protein